MGEKKNCDTQNILRIVFLLYENLMKNSVVKIYLPNVLITNAELASASSFQNLV